MSVVLPEPMSPVMTTKPSASQIVDSMYAFARACCLLANRNCGSGVSRNGGSVSLNSSQYMAIAVRGPLTTGSETTPKAVLFRGAESLIRPKNHGPQRVQALEQPGAHRVHERAVSDLSSRVAGSCRSRAGERRKCRARCRAPVGAPASSASPHGRGPTHRRAANRARRASDSRTDSSQRLRSSSARSCGRAAPSRSRRALLSCGRTRRSARRGIGASP